MEKPRFLMVYDPRRPAFFRDLPFRLTPEQVKFIKDNKPASALASGVDLEVLKAFQRPENLALLK